MIRRPARLFLVLSGAVWLSACGSSPQDEVVGLPTIDPAFSATTLETPGVPVSNVGLNAAFVRLPSGAGQIVSVRERRYVNGASQQIILDGESVKGMENRIDISVQTQAEGGRGDIYVPISPPTEAGISAEIADRFPNVSMQVTERPLANSYGPYGLAIGRLGSGARCVYAWQWIDDLNATRNGQGNLLQRLSMTSGTASAPASIRVRVCRKDVSVDQLAGYITQMVIGSAQTINRLLAQGGVADTGSADRRVAFAAPVTRASTLEAELGTPEPAPKEARAPAPRRVARAAAPRPRRAVAAREPVEPQVVSPVVQAPVVAVSNQNPYGGRYLAPVQNAPAQYRNIAGQAPAAPAYAAPVPTLPSSSLDPSLPAQAYQGPRATTQRPPPAQGTYKY